MALIKLYEAVNPSVLYASESLSGGYGWYMRRYDCVVWSSGSFSNGRYKIFRDGSVARVCASDGIASSYDFDLDLVYLNNTSGIQNFYNDPISMKWDPSRLARFTSLSVGHDNSVLWNGVVYRLFGTTVTKHSLNGTSQGSFSVTSSITPFSADVMAITDDGILVGVDTDNGTYGVVSFYNLHTSTLLHTSTFDRASRAFVDTTYKNIWSVNLASGRMQVWSFDVAPSSFSAITMGSNRARYRQDDLSVTLRGSVSEPVPDWPVKWTLTTSEGHLRYVVTRTNTSGVATNLYCGPGATDYVGGTQTITVETGY